MLYDANAPVYWRLAAPKRYAAWKRTLKIVGPGVATNRAAERTAVVLEDLLKRSK